MNVVKCFAAGCLGALVGAAIWAAVGYFLHAELGWIAWGIGFLAGFGTRALAGDEAGPATGAAAVVAAILGVLAGKFLVAHFLVQAAMAGAAATPGQLPTDEDVMVVYADESAKQKIDAGETIAWPVGVTYEDADEKADYPAPIWAEAEVRWKALSDAEKEQAKRDHAAEVAKAMQLLGTQLRWYGFVQSFDWWDGLWMVLATFTAFRMGSSKVEG